MKVFVYGSLLTDFGNHYLLENSKFIQHDAISARLFTHNWSFPFIILKHPMNCLVQGEIYEIDFETSKRLDNLEGYQGYLSENTNFYNKRTVTTVSGHTVFVYEAGTDLSLRNCNWILEGDWKMKDSETDIPMHCHQNLGLYRNNYVAYDRLLSYVKLGNTISIPKESLRSMRYVAEKFKVKISIKKCQLFDATNFWFNISLVKCLDPKILNHFDSIISKYRYTIWSSESQTLNQISAFLHGR
jgi:gamma-glutamylcyclotransferase (GGCT)/AIG2-like uncharacterized protein YtfP